MEPIRIKAVMQANGRLVLENLPFREGTKVVLLIRESLDGADQEPFDPPPADNREIEEE